MSKLEDRQLPKAFFIPYYTQASTLWEHFDTLAKSLRYSGKVHSAGNIPIFR